MRNIRFKCIQVIFLLMFASINAQDFQGKAFYQSKTNIEMDLSASGIPADRIKMIQERMKNQLEKTYVLSFDKTASIYKEEEKLDQAGGTGRGGMRMIMIGGAGTGKHYKNTQTKTSAKENELSGKNFLIKDDLITYEWKMEQETKMIGENVCFKATTVIQRPKRTTSLRFGSGRNNNNEEENNDEDKTPEMEDVIVTAWYAMDIPVGHGPGDYWGLPGLILEISDGNTQILCTKIVMNPKEKAVIAAPTKGKVVTQEEYEVIREEKMKEMQERMGNERQKSGNRGHRIRIGG